MKCIHSLFHQLYYWLIFQWILAESKMQCMFSSKLMTEENPNVKQFPFRYAYSGVLDKRTVQFSYKAKTKSIHFLFWWYLWGWLSQELCLYPNLKTVKAYWAQFAGIQLLYITKLNLVRLGLHTFILFFYSCLKNVPHVIHKEVKWVQFCHGKRPCLIFSLGI